MSQENTLSDSLLLAGAQPSLDINDVYVVKHGALSRFWLKNVRDKSNKESQEVKAVSKMFSCLHSVDDFYHLIDSLPSLLRLVKQLGHCHVVRMETASDLYVRWYFYRERSTGLLEAVKDYLVSNSQTQSIFPNDGNDHYWAKLNRPQYWVWTSPTQGVDLELVHQIKHITGTFGIAVATSAYGGVGHISDLDDNCSQYLGLIAQPMDFMHYVHSEVRPLVYFTNEQINHLVNITLDFAEDVLAFAQDPQENNWRIRQEDTILSLETRISQIAAANPDEQQAIAVGKQILSMVDNANATEDGFLCFCIDLINAVSKTFKQN